MHCNDDAQYLLINIGYNEILSLCDELVSKVLIFPHPTSAGCDPRDEIYRAVHHLCQNILSHNCKLCCQIVDHVGQVKRSYFSAINPSLIQLNLKSRETSGPRLLKFGPLGRQSALLVLVLMLMLMLKNRSGLSSSLALAKAKAASINWMQLLTDLQASLQICS